MKKILFFLFLGIPCLSRAFDITIGSLVYRITDGVHASVLSPSEGHTRDSVFEIPNHITVDGLTYIVNEINNHSGSVTSGTFRGAQFKRIRLSDSIEYIRHNSFADCSKMVSIVLPAKLSNLAKAYGAVFSGCDRLRYLIFLSQIPPLNWQDQGFEATTLYVADIKAYEKENGTAKRKIVPILSFAQDTFSYTGQAPVFPGWKCNVENCKIISLQEPEMQKEAGVHRVVVPITFEYDGFTYTAEVASYYEIKPRTLSVSVRNITREYGEENPAFELSYSGFLNNEGADDLQQLPVATSYANKKSAVGDYEIMASGGEAQNYIFEYHPGTLTVSKRLLQVSISDYTRTYGMENPEFTLEYSGLANNESPYSALTTRPNVQCQATPTSDVGDYPICVSGGEATNYRFSYNNGTLSITQANQRLSWYQEFWDVYVDDQIELTASSSSGLPVEYEISPEGIADIYYAGDVAVLDCQKKGTITVKASQNGNNNYFSAPRISKTIVISNRFDVISISVQSNKPEWGIATITGTGSYSQGETATITATPTEGYRFVNWTKQDGSVFSTKAIHTFTITEDLELTANFKKKPDEVETFTVTLATNNPDWGLVFQLGGGTYEPNDAVTIIASPNEGYRFVNWTKRDGSVFNTDSVHTFAVTENLELTANFEKLPDGVANESQENGNLRVYVQDRTIYLSENRGAVQVYNMAGQCVYNGTATVIPVQQSGVYIVRVGARSQKILVR